MNNGLVWAVQTSEVEVMYDNMVDITISFTFKVLLQNSDHLPLNCNKIKYIHCYEIHSMQNLKTLVQ